MSSAFKKTQKAAARPHRERSQPGFRKKLGLLEKKKDYKLRADNFKKKEKRIFDLKRKAEFKNPDEFYFGMINSRLVDGVHTKNTEGMTKGTLMSLGEFYFRWLENIGIEVGKGAQIPLIFNHLN